MLVILVGIVHNMRYRTRKMAAPNSLNMAINYNKFTSNNINAILAMVKDNLNLDMEEHLRCSLVLKRLILDLVMSLS